MRARAALSASLVRTRMVAELAMFGAALKTVLTRWTTI
jgi:hypothetical protein